MLSTILLFVAAVVFFLVVTSILRGTPFEGRMFGWGAGYQPRRGKDSTAKDALGRDIADSRCSSVLKNPKK